MIRLLLGLGILAFPLILSLGFACCINDDDGISNEDIWAEENSAKLRKAALQSQSLQIHRVFLCNLSSTVSVRTWYFEIVEQSVDGSDGSQMTTVIAQETLPFVVGNF